ncbi:MAG: OB-fold nucleic acid binding domain-containing protein [Acidobacteriia bacterium]|nr:OB-fold nucleic acid binding domain-containing protein [Terriglobia bacterium]
MKKTSAILAVCGGLFMAALPAAAHHSFAAEFDASKPITVKGTVTKLDWVNPHSHLLFDVKAEDGTMQHWAAECLPPNGLYRQGWRKDSVKPGDEVVVTGFKAKDGTYYMWTQTVTMADGRRLFSGSPEGQGPGGGAPGGANAPAREGAPPKE